MALAQRDRLVAERAVIAGQRDAAQTHAAVEEANAQSSTTAFYALLAAAVLALIIIAAVYLNKSQSTGYDSRIACAPRGHGPAARSGLAAGRINPRSGLTAAAGNCCHPAPAHSGRDSGSCFSDPGACGNISRAFRSRSPAFACQQHGSGPAQWQRSPGRFRRDRNALGWRQCNNPGAGDDRAVKASAAGASNDEAEKKVQ